MKKIIFILCLLYFSSPCSRIGGAYAQWQPDVRLTNNPGNSYTVYNNARSIASSGNDVHAVWWDSRDGNWEIYYKGSLDGGINWGTDTRLTINSGGSVTPSVTVSGFDVHVIWWDDRDGNGEIYYKRSIDGGINWGADARLTNDTTESRNPSVSASGLSVHAVWQDVDNISSGAYEIYYKRSTNRGESWGPVSRLTYDSTASSPSVSASGSFVHLVWYDERDGNREIYYKRSSDGGISWGAGMRLTNNSAGSWGPSVSVSGSVVHVVWYDERDGNREIYYKRSINGGFDWGTDMRLTNNSANSEDPSISAADSVVHVVWMDNRDGNGEIYYKRSIYGGTSWEPDTRLTYNSSSSSRPSLSESDSVVHVVWYDNRDGNTEIYYKRNPAANHTDFLRNGINKPILDNQNTFDTIIVSNDFLTGFVADINLRIDTVSHTNDADLEFILIHQGISDTVVYRVGGSGDNFIGTILDDGALVIVSSGTAPFTGTFKPAKPLSQFVNSNPAGSWILRIYDRSTGNTGTLKAWGITLLISNTPIGIQKIFNHIPESFSLSQNYPNPFNPTTKIRFDIPPSEGAGRRIISIIIYDILGREISTLVNEQLTPGTYEVEWNGSNFSSGVYFYKLITNSFSQTRKMILIK